MISERSAVLRVETRYPARAIKQPDESRLYTLDFTELR